MWFLNHRDVLFGSLLSKNIPQREASYQGSFSALHKGSGFSVVGSILPAAVSAVDVKWAWVLFQLEQIIRVFSVNSLQKSLCFESTVAIYI